jgi:hypothetical protein
VSGYYTAIGFYHDITESVIATFAHDDFGVSVKSFYLWHRIQVGRKGDSKISTCGAGTHIAHFSMQVADIVNPQAPAIAGH